MKQSTRKSIFFSLAFVIAIGISVFAIKTIHALQQRSWETVAPVNVELIAVSVEYFKNEEGYYPKSLVELAGYTRSDQKFIKTLLDKTNSFQYDYQVVSNGFVIKVTKPIGFLSVHEEFVKHFKDGEASVLHKASEPPISVNGQEQK